MRVTYGRELKVKKCLDEYSIENYIPMRYEVFDNNGKRIKNLVPAVHNLLFIHASQNEITDMKKQISRLEPLRFMTTKHYDRQFVVNEILIVPDKQMEDFIRVTSNSDNDIIYLNYNDFVANKGESVIITDGPFAGVEGKIKRIMKNKRFVVEIEGLAAVAISFVPRCYLNKL